jgi:hypothetical protein
MYWHASSRHRAGGFYYCAVRNLERKRDRYDSDFIYRASKNLRDSARKRRQTIERRKEIGELRDEYVAPERAEAFITLMADRVLERVKRRLPAS